MTISCVIAGARGRMGAALRAAAAARANVRVVAGAEREAGVLDGLPLYADPAEAAALGADVWIDFTTPAATLKALRAVADAGMSAAVIGTTGFTAADEAQIEAAAERLAIVKAGNFSLGVALVCALVQRAAQALPAHGWDIEILEAHHRHKADAPSGTALMLAEAAARGRGAPLDALRLPPRQGQTGPRPEGGIGFAVLRGGGVIGRHEASFFGAHEVVTLSHEAMDRSVFADGALTAAEWAVRQPPGLYGVADVLGL